MQDKLTIRLDEAERNALFSAALRDLRHPREQARYILRSVLLGDRAGPEPPEPRKDNGAAMLDRASGAVAG